MVGRELFGVMIGDCFYSLCAKMSSVFLSVLSGLGLAVYVQLVVTIV